MIEISIENAATKKLDWELVNEITRLMLSNLSNSYISVADIIAGRVVDKSANKTPNLEMASIGVLHDNILREIEGIFSDQVDDTDNVKYIALAYMDDKLVGCSIFTISKIEGQNGYYANLEDIVIDSRHRGQNYAKQMLQKMEAFLLERKIAFAVLESSMSNHITHLFVEGSGYIKVSYSYYKKLGDY